MTPTEAIRSLTATARLADLSGPFVIRVSNGVNWYWKRRVERKGRIVGAWLDLSDECRLLFKSRHGKRHQNEIVGIQRFDGPTAFEQSQQIVNRWLLSNKFYKEDLTPDLSAELNAVTRRAFVAQWIVETYQQNSLLSLMGKK